MRQIQIGLISLLILLISACRTIDPCLKCPVRTKDSIVIRTVEQEIPVMIKDTIKIREFIPNPCAELCDEFGHLRQEFRKEVKTSVGSTATISVQGGSLSIATPVDSLKTKAVVTTTVPEHYREVEVPARCDRRHITDFEIFQLYAGRLAILVLLGLGAWKLWRH